MAMAFGSIPPLALACVDLFHATDVAPPSSCETEASECPNPDAAQDIPSPDLCTPDAYAKATRTCAWLGGCLGPGDTTSFGSCIMHALSAFDCAYNPTLRPRGAVAQLWNCLGSVMSCDHVRSCVYGSAVPSCPIEPVLEASSCIEGDSGSASVACNLASKLVGASVCTLRGQRCTPLDPSRSACTGDLGAACDGPPRCVGTGAVTCRNIAGRDLDDGFDCAGVGSGRCIDDGEGPACAPSRSAGTCRVGTKTSFACAEDGGVAERCIDGRALQIRCSALGMVCDPNGSSPAPFITACKNQSPDTQCFVKTDQCIGEQLIGCANDRLVQVDCRALGLGACSERGGRASCSPP